MCPCSEHKLTDFIGQHPRKTSSRHDNISNVPLKITGPTVGSPLTKIFNEFLCLGVFPDIMKLLQVVPLYKEKKKYLEKNYRPISLLTTMSKLLEKIVYSRVYKFLNDINQFHEVRDQCEFAGTGASLRVRGVRDQCESPGTTASLRVEASETGVSLQGLQQV